VAHSQGWLFMKKLKLFTFSNNFILFAPLAFIIRQQKGLTGSEIFILQALLAIMIILLEVPSGYLADKLGYKKSILLGQLFLILSRLIFWLGFGFNILVLDTIFLGMSNAILSGVIEAYIYENDSEGFGENIGKIYNFSTYGFICSNLLFAVIVLLGNNQLILGTFIANVISFIVALSLPQIKKTPKKHLESKEIHFQQIKDSKSAFKNLKFWFLSFLNALIGVGMVVFNLLFVILLSQNGFQTIYFSWIILAYAFVELSVRYTDKLIKYFTRNIFLLLVLAILGVLFIAFYTLNQVIILIILGAFALPLLIMLSITTLEANNQFIDEIGKEEQRVTFLSVFNLTGRIFEVILFFAISIGFSNAKIIFLCLGLLYLVTLAIISVVSRNS
jgi:MFS family permease